MQKKKLDELVSEGLLIPLNSKTNKPDWRWEMGFRQGQEWSKGGKNET